MSVVSEEDQRDIRDSLAGNEEAYARLVDRYEPQVFTQMWRFTRDRMVLDELVQDVFVEVYLNLRKFRGEAPLFFWIRRIATRVGYRHWKLQRRIQKRRELVNQNPGLLLRVPKDASPSEAGDMLFQMLALLPPKDRLVLTMYYYEECNSREIAERMGWSPTLVRVRIHRACKKLRTLLSDAGYGRSHHE